MSKIDVSWKILGIYLLVLFLVCICSPASGQIVTTHFNAGWNSPNKVKFVGELTDCEIIHVDIVDSPKLQVKHKIVIVPTIVIFKDGEEVKRFQADISFSMKATRKEIQGVIDELLMSDF